jgi:hypothetical protein
LLFEYYLQRDEQRGNIIPSLTPMSFEEVILLINYQDHGISSFKNPNPKTYRKVKNIRIFDFFTNGSDKKPPTPHENKVRFNKYTSIDGHGSIPFSNCIHSALCFSDSLLPYLRSISLILSQTYTNGTIELACYDGVVFGY